MSTTVRSCPIQQPAGYACTREYGHMGPCACVPHQPADFPPIAPMQADLFQKIFTGFGANWKWASIDYRGVARVHTFEPTFTDTGRIRMPSGKHNSCPCEAFDMVDGLPEGWSPIWTSRNSAPPYNTDRFGVLLPDGADPVEAADVLDTRSTMVPPLEAIPVPLPAPQQTAIPDVPFMNYVVQYRLVGSRVTCNPPPLDTDQDVLCMVHQDNRQVIARAMVAEGFVPEGSWPSDIEAVASHDQVFESMRKGSMNYIITSDDDFYKRFSAATDLAKKLNIMTKAGRIELFQAVLYGNAPK